MRRKRCPSAGATTRCGVLVPAGTEMRIKEIITADRAGSLYNSYTKWKYCVAGRWRLDRRIVDTGSPDGTEHRLAS